MTLGEIIFLVFIGIIVVIFAFAAITYTLEVRDYGQEWKPIAIFQAGVFVVILLIFLLGWDSISESI